MWSNNDRSNSKIETGSFYEAQAKQFLLDQGLIFIEQNVNFKTGELDLVMKHDKHLVFVEVRYRSSQEYGGAVTSITASKQSRVRRAAQTYLQRHFGNRPPPCRIDVIAFEGADTEAIWIKNAFA